jgi:hypothetical protein
MRLTLLLVCCVLLLNRIWRVLPAYAQLDACDPELMRIADPQNPLSYQPRGDRCEGIYIQRVSASGGLLLASLTESDASFDVQAVRSIEIGWNAPDSSPVHIRAMSLRPRVYHQMDTIQIAKSGTYSWPTTLLSAIHIQAADLGVLAWVSMPPGSEMERIYVPVTWRGGQKPAPLDYSFTLISPHELAEVRLSVAKRGTNGRLESPAPNATLLKNGYYPAESPLRVDLPRRSRPGLYLVEVSARIRSGGPASTRFWYYRAN